MKPVSKDLEEKLVRARFPGTPPFSLDELLEELSYNDDMYTYYIFEDESEMMFTEWLYTTMRDPDKAAAVWLATRGKK